jgi:predicted nucleic acid-binding protein
MRVVFDTNVLLDIALSRQPFAGSSMAAFELVRRGLDLPLVAPHALATFYYLVAQAYDRERADTAVKDLLITAEVTRFDHDAALRCWELGMPDFEDGMIVSAAMESEADLILTRNESDFANSPIQVQNPEDFCRNAPSFDS